MKDRALIFGISLRSLLCTPWHRMLNAVDPPVIVLLYHRVTKLQSDPEMLAVSPDNFRAQMGYLKENVPLVRFEDEWTNLAGPAVAITFDDGYADNGLEALPILEELEVPATFFVSTGPIGSGSGFWWDEVERLILGAESLPPSFTFNDGSFSSTWATGTGAERLAFFQEFIRFLTDVDTSSRNSWLSRLRTWVEEEGRPASCGQRAMSVTELRQLAASPWATIGAHTVTHTRLSALPLAAQREEILSSKMQLEEWLGKEVTTFSYPYGRRCHYDKESAELCSELGFSKAAANFPGQAHRWTDRYQIPRHLVRNWKVETFAEKLRGFWTR